MQLLAELKRVLILFHFFAIAISESSLSRYYSVIAPGTIKSNRNYTVCVTLHSPGQPAIFRVGLVGEPLFNLYETVELQPFESKSIDFLPPKLALNYEYNLLVEGVKGIRFRNITKLNVDVTESLKIYIQTDKGVYKPGDMVQFRVIILDEHLKPFKSVEPVRVEVRDGYNNRVKQFKDIDLNTGVFSSKLQLSEHPIMGTWVIIVAISGRYDLAHQKFFQVEQYVLPKFSVYIENDPDFVLGSRSITVDVYGKYTYGKYVEGTAKIEIIHPYTNETISSQDRPIKNVRARFELDLYQIPQLEGFPWIGVLASVTEQQTGLKQVTRQHVNIHKEKYQIIVPETDIEFHDSKPYKMKAYVQHWNGTRVIDQKMPIIMQHGSRTYRAVQDVQGMATFTFDYALEANNIFTYGESKTIVSNIFIRNNFRFDEILTHCTLKWKEGRLKFGTTIDIEVTSQFVIPYIVYIISSHGSIVRQQFIRLPPHQKSYTITIKPGVDMLTTSHIYVHYIEMDRFRYCELQLNFPQEFENQVSIDVPTTALPGENVTLILKAEPNSFVGLLAVDLSVHLLNSDYNLNKRDIFQSLLYDRFFLPVSANYPGDQSGLITQTNAPYIYVRPQDSLQTAPASPYDSVRIRSKFPETWIFMDLNINEPFTSLSLNVPDTITTWLITAFSVNTETGLGMVTDPANLTVFKPFFISTNLPYSIRRGEIVKISVTAFNYHSQDLETSITMKSNEEDFEFVTEQNIILGKTYDSKQVNIPANSGRSEFFMIKPKKLGAIDIHLEGVNHMFRDTVIQKLKVEPEGQIKLQTENAYVHLLGDGQEYKTIFQINIPSNVVPASEFIQLSIGGSALASILENLEELVQLPTGCGEQNMINFAPNILVVDYLKSLSKTSENSILMEKALQFIQQGYQQELTYRHTGGAYSVFGPRSKAVPSTWLTAYVIRFFIKALRYAPIEARVVESGLEYLAEKQLAGGYFPLTGYLFYPAHQNRYGFTAFVLMTFLESPKYARKYKSVIRKSVDFLTNNLNTIEDTYALSIMATALQMAKSEHAPAVIHKLMSRAKEGNGYKWWSSSRYGQTNDVEITAYVLMASLEISTVDHVPIFKWLVDQRNNAGGFKSTHDTVVALQALIKYSQRYPSANDTMLKVEYAARDGGSKILKSGVFGVDPTNILILQKQEFPHSTRSLHIHGLGYGSSLLQLSYQYYIVPETESKSHQHNVIISARRDAPSDNFTIPTLEQLPKDLKSFHITTLAKISKAHMLEMDICFEFKPSEILKYRKTNMVIMEVSLPSGFVVSSDAIKELLDEDFVARTKLKNQDSLIFIYFEHLRADAGEKCLSLKADMAHEVKMLKPTSIVMYDYYNLNYRDSVFYEIEK